MRNSSKEHHVEFDYSPVYAQLVDLFISIGRRWVDLSHLIENVRKTRFVLAQAA